MRKRGGGNDGRILDAHPVMHLVALLQPAQNGNGVLDVGFTHKNDLETALQRGVFLDVFAIFVERGGADSAQFAASQRRFQHVAGINSAFSRARAHQRVQLINEQNDLALGFLNLLEHRLKPVFKFSTVPAAPPSAGGLAGCSEFKVQLVLWLIRQAEA